VEKQKRIPWLYFIFGAIVLVSWGTYMISTNSFHIYKDRWAAPLTMIFGSFVGGATPEGGAAVAYPVFTLLLKISPDIARNFGFAIQSIGMTSASLLILGMGVKLDWNYIKYVTFSGFFGLIFGSYYIVPLISPPLAKLFFVSLWLGFGIVLWRQNRSENREVYDKIENLMRSDIVRLLIFGFLGGIISSIFGTGINIFTFCLMTIYYRVSEKVATPSSVIIMTIETLLGFFLHAKILNDFQEEAFYLWMTCVPVVLIFAPLGAFIVSRINRKNVAKILYLVLIIQFVGAIIVIKPNLVQSLICFSIMICSILLFTYLSKLSHRKEVG
jgi:uncharacterized membrane protein YfcA